MASKREWDKHKYVAKIPLKTTSKDKKWRYFYSTKTYQAYLKGKQTKKSDTKTRKKSNFFSRLIDKSKKIVSSVCKSVNKVSDLSKSTIEKGKSAIGAILDHKYVAKVKLANGKYRYFYSDKEYKAYLKGKEFIEKNADKALSMTPSEMFDHYADNFMAYAIVNGIGSTIFNMAAAGFTALKVKMETPKSFDELDKIDRPVSNDTDQALVNPEYNPNDYGSSMNCSFCTAAYDLRSRGYDVEANMISTMEAYDAATIRDWYDGEEFSGYFSVNDLGVDVTETHVNYSLKKYGDGARGHFLLYWEQGGGHDVIWEVENGEVVIRDCQLNREVDLSEYLELSSEVAWFRTDNVEPNEKVLRTVKNRD